MPSLISYYTLLSAFIQPKVDLISAICYKEIEIYEKDGITNVLLRKNPKPES